MKKSKVNDEELSLTQEIEQVLNEKKKKSSKKIVKKEKETEKKVVDEKKTSKKEVEKTSPKKVKKDEEEVSIKKVKVSKDVDLEEVKKEIKKVDSKKVEKENDDIYLTAAFKPLKTTTKIKKMVIKPILIIIFLVALVGALGYYVGLPMYKDYLSSKPEKVFKEVFNKYEEYSKRILVKDEKNTVLNFSIDTNDKALSSLNKANFGVSLNNDNGNYFEEFYIQKKKELKTSYYESDNSYYAFLSDEYVMLDDDCADDYYNRLLKYWSNGGINNLNDQMIKSLNELLTSENLKQEKDDLEINGKKYDVVVNSLELDASDLQKIADDLILTKKNDRENNDLYDYFVKRIKKIIDSNKELTTILKLNIYLDNQNSFVGLDIEYQGFRIAYYYKTNDNVELYLNVKYKKKNANMKVQGSKELKGNLQGLSINSFEFDEVSDDTWKINCNVESSKYEYVSSIVLNFSDNGFNGSLDLDYDDKFFNIAYYYKKTDVSQQFSDNISIKGIGSDSALMASSLLNEGYYFDYRKINKIKDIYKLPINYIIGGLNGKNSKS